LRESYNYLLEQVCFCRSVLVKNDTPNEVLEQHPIINTKRQYLFLQVGDPKIDYQHLHQYQF
jgi:hypothetical protein